MMRSMYSGVSGLKAHQVKMDVIGNNIANVNTVGFKAQRVTFNEVFSQTMQGASGASKDTGRGGTNPMQVGLGVNVSAIDSIMTTGSAQRTDNPFDVMVSGSGFLVVEDTSGKYFTKAGALRLDEEGNLIIPNGMKVQGWPATADGKAIAKGEVTDIKLGDTSNLISNPEATTSVKLAGNLNVKDSPVATQIKMYDSLGNYYTTNLSLTYDEKATPPVWNIQPQTFDADGNLQDGITGTHVKLVDTNGNSQLVPVGDMYDSTALNAAIAFDTNGKIDLANCKGLNADGKLNLTGVKLPNVNATIAGGTGNTLSIDLSSLTQVSTKTNLESKVENGRATGEMVGYNVGTDGTITAHYDNGESKLLGQIVVAEFSNPMGLERMGDNVFRATSNSGEFDNIGQAGVFQAGVLEMSNVDLSGEFTEMITTQRGFQANSRIISTSDEMLQELVNIKR